MKTRKLHSGTALIWSCVDVVSCPVMSSTPAAPCRRWPGALSSRQLSGSQHLVGALFQPSGVFLEEYTPLSLLNVPCSVFPPD